MFAREYFLGFVKLLAQKDNSGLKSSPLWLWLQAIEV